MSPVVVIILILLIIGIIIGGWLWYSQTGTPGSDSGSGPPLPSIDNCTSAFYIDQSSYCIDPSKNSSGIRWKWQDTDVARACKANVDKYTVNLHSSWDPTFVISTDVKGSETLQTGVTMFDQFINGKTLTYSVQPFSSNGTSITSSPVSIDISSSQASQDCSKWGITPLDAVPGWNKNKNMVYVQGKNNGGGNITQMRVYLNNKLINDSNNMYDGSTVDRVVPKGAMIKIGCNSQTGSDSQWSYDELLAGNPSGSKVRLAGSCPAGHPQGHWSLAAI